MPDINISEKLLSRPIVIARGLNRQDKNFQNAEASFGDLCAYLSFPRVGAKDGDCILSGKVVGGQRIANNMVENYILMLDIDNGMSVEDGIKLVKDRGLCAVIWTTYSHMKTTTTVKQAALQTFLNRRNQVLAFELDDITGQICDYLHDEKKYTGPILNSVAFEQTTKTHAPGGVEYVITHAPMPRFRVLFLLDKPYSFSVGLQKDRIKEWRLRYQNFCKALGVVHDTSCEDPSRLMYTPSIPNEGAPFEVYFIDGAPLDLDEYATKVNAFADNPNAPSRIRGNNTQARMYTPETPGLLHFVKNAPDFDIVSCVHALIPDSVRGPAAQGNGVCLRCPNEDAHSNVDLNDKAFFVSISASGWYAGCLHQTCKSQSNDDRLWYLDRMCVEHGWTVDDLAPFSPTFQATLSANIEHKNEKTREYETEAEFWADVDRNLVNVDQIIENAVLTDEASMKYACAVIARGPRIQHVPRIRRLSEVTDAGKADIRRLVKEQGERYDSYLITQKLENEEDDDVDNEKDSNSVATAPPPPTDFDDTHVVYKNWPPKVQLDAMVAIITRINNTVDPDAGTTKPIVYRNELGELCVVAHVGEKTLIKNIDSTGLGAIALKNIPYKSVNTQTGLVNDVVPDKTVIGMMASDAELPFPIIRSISSVPISGPDGTLQTEKGYVASMRTYLSVNKGDWSPVSEKVSVDELARAWDILIEAIRDFPFSDDFTGNDLLPIKSDEKDADGFPRPNFERGASSRMNAIAMILQRFARALIKGPCPAYFIDKAEAGTGAGYLTNVMACPLTGEMATGTVMAQSDDEFRKNITAAIIGGDPYVFVDNIDRTVTSSAFAILLTSGKWKDRILGQSVQTDIEVNSTWVLTGNNAGFTYELSRRFVPIRLDANMADPALDRGANDFKHYNLSEWLREKRKELVWACHTIIQAWVKGSEEFGLAGMVTADKYRDTGVEIDGTVHSVKHMTLNSFDAYVNTMGGIFITSAQMLGNSDILKFMANHSAFTDNSRTDTKTEVGAVQDMFDTFGTHKAFAAKDVILACIDRMTGKLKDVYPVSGRDDDELARKLGSWLSKHVSKRTFQIELEDGTTTTIKLVRTGSGRNTRKYSFVRV